MSFSSDAAQTVTVSESGYTGRFTESDNCNPYSGTIASVALASTATGAATYAVTPQGAGTCTVTISDASGKSVAVGVTVSIAAITVQ
jgi:hypothetical protein